MGDHSPRVRGQQVLGVNYFEETEQQKLCGQYAMHRLDGCVCSLCGAKVR
jgi:hypothetical protein